MAKDLTGIESAFCTEWSGWDEVDTGVLQFYNPKLRTVIASVLKSHGFMQIDTMVVDTQKNMVEFYSGDECKSFNLNVSLGTLIEQ